MVSPRFQAKGSDEEMDWINTVLASGKKRVVFIDETDQPRDVMNADRYLRDVYLNPEKRYPTQVLPQTHCAGKGRHNPGKYFVSF